MKIGKNRNTLIDANSTKFTVTSQTLHTSSYYGAWRIDWIWQLTLGAPKSHAFSMNEFSLRDRSDDTFLILLRKAT